MPRGLSEILELGTAKRPKRGPKVWRKKSDDPMKPERPDMTDFGNSGVRPAFLGPEYARTDHPRDVGRTNPKALESVNDPKGRTLDELRAERAERERRRREFFEQNKWKDLPEELKYRRTIQKGYEDSRYYPEARQQGLDLSEAARKQRAADLGYDTGEVWWHGSDDGPLEKFDPSVGLYPYTTYFAADPKTAAGFGGTGIPVHLKNDRLLDAANAEHAQILREVAKEIGVKPPFSYRSGKKTGVANAAPSFEWYDNQFSHGERKRLHEALTARGFDGMLLSGDGPNVQAAIWNHSAIRHVDAVFNPKHAASEDIYSEADTEDQARYG